MNIKEDVLSSLHSRYLLDIANLTNLPQLKSYYRTTALLANDNCPIVKTSKQLCSKCLLYANETNFHHTLIPGKRQLEKIPTIRSISFRERRKKIQLNKAGQHLKITCTTCKSANKQLMPLGSRPKPSRNTIIDLTNTPQTRKRKRKDPTAGLFLCPAKRPNLRNPPALIAPSNNPPTLIAPSNQQTIISPQTKKNKNRNIRRAKKRKKTTQASGKNERVVGLASTDAMRQDIRTLTLQRNDPNQLNSKAQKKKLKGKINKLKQNINNLVYVQQKPQNGLKDFLSTLSA